MIHARRNRLSRLAVTVAVLTVGAAGLLAHGAAPAKAPASAPAALVIPGGEGAAVPAEQEKLADLASALKALAAEDPSPDQAMMRQAFATAGFSGESVEVSQDITPTGLAVDSIRGAAVRDGSCLFGEVREGQVAVTALPVLAAGNCFVGDQR